MSENMEESAVISYEMAAGYKKKLQLDEYSQATVEKYMRDIRFFFQFLSGHGAVSKELMINFKQELASRYAVSSANSMMVAVNRFLKYAGLSDCCVKLFRTQRNIFCEKDRELTKMEYFRLLEEAKRRKDERLCLIMQTICSTGIRVSELKYIDVSAIERQCAQVSCKGKMRTIFLPGQLCKMLKRYCKRRNIRSGCIFISRNGRPVDRSNIWTAMKQLCKYSSVPPEKVFPHNLRHLFARTFYSMEKDIVRLADLLGHASMETTRIYTISSGSDHSRKLARMRLCLQS